MTIGSLSAPNGYTESNTMLDPSCDTANSYGWMFEISFSTVRSVSVRRYRSVLLSVSAPTSCSFVRK